MKKLKVFGCDVIGFILTTLFIRKDQNEKNISYKYMGKRGRHLLRG